MAPPSSEHARSHRGGSWWWLCGALSVYAALFLIYSQTAAFTWDESYHLLAAQLVNAGKRPYLDFCFPQSPLNVYWTAAWMRVLGQSWRLPHAVEALLTVGAVWLMADYAFVRFPISTWRFAAAIFVGLATGLNAMVFMYGPVAQPYGICLFLMALAFRVSVRAVERNGIVLAGLAGLYAGAAAASSLLTAAAAPVFLVWIFLRNRAGSRWRKLCAFGIGAAVPFAPVFWLFASGPRQTWFNLVQYHFFYRKLYWAETTRHDLEVLTSWINSGQSLLFGLLAVAGLFYVARASRWPGELKAEIYLCAWLAAALSAEVGRAHPTFAQYFLLIVPFVAIPAAAGLYAVVSRAPGPRGQQWPVALVLVLLGFGLARALYEGRDDTTWAVYERLARKVDQVTPPGALLFADEPIYFLTHRTPPPGFELYYTHKLSLPPADAALLHIINRAEVRRQAQSGMFATAYSCDEGDIDYYGLKNLYRQRVSMEDCTIFWDRTR